MAEVSNQTVEAPYKVYGTNEPYNGLTVEVGGFLYSTVGGALEGDSMQLTANVQPQQTQPTPPNGNDNQTLGGAGLAGNPNQMQQDQLMGGTQGTSGAGAVNPSNQTGGGSGGSY